MDTRKQKAEKTSKMPIKHSLHSLTGEQADRIVGSPSWWSSINYNRSMPEDLKLSQIGSSMQPPLFRGLHSPVVRKLSNYLRLLFSEIVYCYDDETVLGR